MKRNLVRVSALALGVLFTPLLGSQASIEDNTGADGKYNGDVSGHTFFYVRPQWQSGMPEKESLWRRRAFDGPFGYGCPDGMGGAFQVGVFGGRSTKSARLGEYFMFGGSNVLVASDNQLGLPDINAAQFGIGFTTSFSSTIQFNPRQSVIGGGFEWRQYLGWWNGCGSNWWFDISFPVVRVRNSMNATESVISTGTSLNAAAPTSILQALGGGFNYANVFPATSDFAAGTGSMQFGLIPTGSERLKKTGVADIELKIGHDFLTSDNAYVNGYLGALVPTGNRPKGVYIFEPIVGHNHHAGILIGSEICYDFWNGCDHALSWEIAFDSRYLFKGRETRSMDLRYRPWSRYMLVYETPDAADVGSVSPGINVFTRELDITPRFQLATNTALLYQTVCGFQAEIGYNFWARQAEKAKLRDPFPAGIAVAGLLTDDLGFTTGPQPGFTNLLSNIGNNNSLNNVTLPTIAAGLPTPTTLTAADLDLESATHPATISNIFYGSIGYNFDWWCMPMFLGIGGSYEFSAINTSLNRWTLWGKIGASY